MEEKEHEYTMEAIFHFTCGKCSQWWSYASTEVIDFHITYFNKIGISDG